MKTLFDRRMFVQRLAGAAMLPLVMRTMGAEAAAASGTILVVIDLVGGNDGLNTIVPLSATQFGAYAALRPRVGLPISSLNLTFDPSFQTTVGSGQTYAFNPAMALNYAASTPQKSLPALANSLPGLYNSGRLAMVVGAGLPDTDLQRMNHFCASIDWNIGQPDAWSSGNEPNGWLAQALSQANGGRLGPTASMSGSSLMINTLTTDGLVVGAPLSSFKSSNLGSPYLRSPYLQWLSAPASGGPALNFANSLAVDSLNDSSVVQSIGSNSSVSIADYPWMNPKSITPIELQLSSVAQLIRGGAGIGGYVTAHHGFDTHNAQLGMHASLLSALSGAMANFYVYLKAKNASSNVVIMTISEFGRTPYDNAALGTDHGQASVVFVLGDQVNGGVYGTYPSLTNLDNHQLAVTVDFRNVLSDVINAIGGNAGEIVGQNYPRLGFI